MSFKKIFIVCDGREISYGFSLLHLFQYKNDKDIIMSNMAANTSVEIFSVAALRNANISKNSIQIFVGDKQTVEASFNKVFSQYGMTIWKSELGFVIKADEKKLLGYTYDEFILYANKKRNEYIELEKEYVECIEKLDSNWMIKEFKPVSSEGLFLRKNLSKSKIQQLYDCLAYVFYLEIIGNEMFK